MLTVLTLKHKHKTAVSMKMACYIYLSVKLKVFAISKKRIVSNVRISSGCVNIMGKSTISEQLCSDIH